MTSTQPPLRTPLHALHVELGAKMVPFAGYDMPVQYTTGVLQEHNHTRAQAGLFDVSHMGQVRLSGSNAATAMETLVPIDVIGLRSGQQRYALFTNDSGGILDDLMVARLGNDLLVVVNAACKEQDIALMQRGLAGKCTVEQLMDRALLALQGPAACTVLQRLASTVADMKFMDIARVTLNGADANARRIGRVTSGGPSPTLGTPVAMGYVEPASAAIRAKLFAEVRGKRVPMEVTRTPFVPQRYYRGCHHFAGITQTAP